MTREAHDYPTSVRKAVRALRRWDGESVADLNRLLGESVAAASAAGLGGYGLRGHCPHDVRWALGQAQDNRRISAGCGGVWNANDCRPSVVDVEDASGGALSMRGDRVILWQVVDDETFSDPVNHAETGRPVSPAAHPRA